MGTADGSSIGNPPVGDFYIFIDSNNSNSYTLRDSTGADTILGSGGGGGVVSVTGLNTDNTDPLNPIVKLVVDNTTITGEGTIASPLISLGTLYGLYAQTSLSATITGTTETSIIGTGVGGLTVPANSFSVGDSFHAKIGGLIGDTSNGDDITIRIKTGGVILASTGLFTLDNTQSIASGGEGWECELDFTIASLGVLGEICTNGNFAYTKTGDKKVSGTVFQDVQRINTTVANTLDITVEWNQTGTEIYSANFVLHKTF